jgi:teichoic acid transport system permease protein
VDGWQLAVVEANPLLIFIELMRHSLMEGVTLAAPPAQLWIEAVIWTVERPSVAPRSGTRTST